MNGRDSSDLQACARDLVARAEAIVVLTGAGVSAESGVPTFRGAEGLWRSFRPEELATPTAFARDPRLVWEWYDWRRRHVLGCRPNAAHIALAKLALGGGSRVRIITHNVDGLHAVAARDTAVFSTPPGDADAALPLELHGSLFRVRCTACGARRAHVDPIDSSSCETLPHCDACGGLSRPDIVWFGEALDDVVLGEARERASAADLCIVVGTSAVVQPAASLALLTKRAGGRVIEVNPEETPLTPLADASIRATAVEAVPQIVG
ncbi:MAG: NAD-dependent deacetylase [Gemmatimonadaceae bacterium]